MFKLTSNQIPYRWLVPIPLLLIIYALSSMPPSSIVSSLIELVVIHHPGLHDYYATVGYAPTLLNAGIVGLIVLGLLKFHKLPMNANGVSALFIVMGFSFIGKNFINIIPFILGGYLYAFLQKIPIKRVLVAALLVTCLAPLIEFTMAVLPYSFTADYAVSLLVGVLVTLVAIPVASHILLTHQGYNLYNMGYAAGFIGIIAVSILRGLGLDVEQLSIVSKIGDFNLVYIMIAINIYLIVIGYLAKSDLDKPYRQIFFYSGRLVTDFTRVMGPGMTMINMGIMGTIGLAFVLAFNVSLTGAIIAGLFTLTGFASFGNHPKNTVPIMIGAMLGVLFTNHSLTVSSGMIAVLFSTTLAPIAGEYGIIVGLGVGLLHTNLVSSMAGLHAGMNLYNNGFSGGLIATLIVPIIDAYQEEK